jgi:hypothetical protein
MVYICMSYIAYMAYIIIIIIIIIIIKIHLFSMLRENEVKAL